MTNLDVGDYVTHIDHGIGKFGGLQKIDVEGKKQEAIKLVYGERDVLYLSIHSLHKITKFNGKDGKPPKVYKLGSKAWKTLKQKTKSRVKEIAFNLIKVYAKRKLEKGFQYKPDSYLQHELEASFIYEDTPDQITSTADIKADMESERPMDRLVCGDVGFGKTEVALRAAFAVAMEGKQVAIVVPTTLLCRQHFMNFRDRFRGFPVCVKQLSRLVTQKEMGNIKEGMKKGDVDIVIGTHALLAKDVGFRDLGLLIIDEEQHFGVAHKERLKGIRSDVHVLTLTATPIPRTLQMALTGIREMSLIATPPVDRLAVRTFILPFDPVIIREAILREQYRGGQTFYVCPRINDMEMVADRLADLVPEAKVAMVNGQMPVADLEDIISRFYDGAYDVLLSTNIIESGLDLPAVNTIIIHRADMFGLAQLYQLRGRVGRSKTRAYAYLTLPPGKMLTKAAEKLSLIHI